MGCWRTKVLQKGLKMREKSRYRKPRYSLARGEECKESGKATAESILIGEALRTVVRQQSFAQVKRSGCLYKDQRGFTLIEMLAVVAIIATIAIVLIAGYKNIVPYASETTAEVMIGRLNNAANEWVMLKIQTGAPSTRLKDLGNSLEEAIKSLKAPIKINKDEISVGLPKNIDSERLKNLEIKYSEGEFFRGKLEKKKG